MSDVSDEELQKFKDQFYMAIDGVNGNVIMFDVADQFTLLDQLNRCSDELRALMIEMIDYKKIEEKV